MAESMTETEYILDVLGAAKLFRGRSAPSSMQVRERIQRGLPYSSLESVSERLQLSVPEAAVVLQMPSRTLARRKQAGRLAADESDRLYRLAHVVAFAANVLGSDEKAAAWLRRPNRALEHERPIDLLDTDIGARQVEDILGRIAHGVLG
jgi:putative toxin-antitoxin system antitoxin component (TIGR02293 family)